MDEAPQQKGSADGRAQRDRVLVDGGVHSTTNLDLAVLAAPDTVICIAPMAYDPADSPRGLRKALRAPVNFVLRREIFKVRRRGAQVLLLRPGAAQLAEYPINFLSHSGAEQIGRDAYTHTTDQLNGLAVRKLLRNARCDTDQH